MENQRVNLKNRTLFHITKTVYDSIYSVSILAFSIGSQIHGTLQIKSKNANLLNRITVIVPKKQWETVRNLRYCCNKYSGGEPTRSVALTTL